MPYKFVIPASGPTTNHLLKINLDLLTNGVTDGTVPVAGMLGEVQTGSVLQSSPVALTSTTAANVVTKSLTAGNYVVFAMIGFTNTAGPVKMDFGLSTTSATLPGVATTAVPTSNQVRGSILQATLSGDTATSTLVCPVTITATTSVYLVASANFLSGSVSSFGSIQALRIF